MSSAGFILLTDRNSVTTADTLNWATLGGSGTALPAGQLFTSSGGRTAHLPQGAFLLNVGVSQGFNAGFPIGQIVSYSGGDTVIQWVNPISAAGAQVWGVSSAADVTLTALDVLGNPIAGSSLVGSVGGGGGNVSFGLAGFVGLGGTGGQTFYGLRFSNSPQPYAVNILSFTPADTAAITIPAPSSSVVFAAVASALLALRRRRPSAAA